MARAPGEWCVCVYGEAPLKLRTLRKSAAHTLQRLCAPHCVRLQRVGAWGKADVGGAQMRGYAGRGGRALTHTTPHPLAWRRCVVTMPSACGAAACARVVVDP